MSLSKLSISLREKVNPFSVEADSLLKTRCISCRKKERLLRFTDLRRGDHICMNGKMFMLGIGGKQVAAYTHHALVKSIQIVGSATALVTLIHFYTTPYDMTICIQETTEIFDLHYHEINIIRYRYKTHEPEIILERAERLLTQNKQAKYSVFSCNCEHICNWCCVGNAKSFQAESAKDALSGILSGIANVGGKTLGVVCKLLFMSLDDVSKLTSSYLINVPWGTLAVIAILYLLYVVYQNIKLDEERKAGNICYACAHRKKVDIWLQFIAYCGLQVGGLGLLSLVISAGASHGIVLGSLIACSVLSLVCLANAPKFRKLCLTPFQGRYREIKSLRDIWIGDVISFKQWHLRHSCIISGIEFSPGTVYRRGKIKIIHYSQPSTFGRRKIIEEEVLLDLEHDTILGHDYSGYNVHDPETVVNRARQRLGETKFKLTSNRSCHFCHWAKIVESTIEESTKDCDDVEHAVFYLKEVDPRETTSKLPDHSVHIDHTRGRKRASKAIRKMCVRIRDEIKAGELIEYKSCGLTHKAITTDVRFHAKKVSDVFVTLVHYGNDKKIKEETVEFDLNRQDVWIHKYHPLYRYSKEHIIRRARARINEGNYNVICYRSSHFSKEVVEKGHVSTVLDIRDIKPGDAILFPAKSFLKEAIVINVTIGDSIQTSVGELDIIHYAFKNCMPPLTVKEETISIDLQKEKICVRNYEGYITYPPDKVIKRAKSRLGEQRHSICRTTSEDFVHWTKVVQYPTEITELKKLSDTESRTSLLIPKAGEYKKGLQRFGVWTWDELFPGMMVEYRENLCKTQGIISDVDVKSQTIKVIKYGSDGILYPMIIMEKSVKLNIHRDDICTYRGHPRKSFKSSVVIANALRRLGEKKNGKSSWDFCKECLVKPMQL
ncbi:uncharacterized protein LOC132730717 [Ruditapes philippinarum]|uniref:uncharacterized protein LOC132730717 n=1 Tax=Ruditapes philippinarum TaxID=129788 RepID=UPI00295C16D0|nr:uncharacterized protein LOC132730717 [Ruditapes philippinarum]